MVCLGTKLEVEIGLIFVMKSFLGQIFVSFSLTRNGRLGETEAIYCIFDVIYHVTCKTQEIDRRSSTRPVVCEEALIYPT